MSGFLLENSSWCCAAAHLGGAKAEMCADEADEDTGVRDGRASHPSWSS